MSSIYDISGTSADSFSLNGKCTLLQGNDAPESYQGLDGDVYFRTHREGHNLDRARTQFKLVSDMEKLLPKMQEIVNKL